MRKPAMAVAVLLTAPEKQILVFNVANNLLKHYGAGNLKLARGRRLRPGPAAAIR